MEVLGLDSNLSHAVKKPCVFDVLVSHLQFLGHDFASRIQAVFFHRFVVTHGLHSVHASVEVVFLGVRGLL